VFPVVRRRTVWLSRDGLTLPRVSRTVVGMETSEYAKGLGYHGMMHRAYRVCRARVAQRMSVIHPGFGAEVLAEFRALVAHLRLEPPRLEGPS
jgi:hypothetical protein